MLIRKFKLKEFNDLMSGHNSSGNRKNTCFEERINFLMLFLVYKGNFSGFVVIFIFP